MPNNNVFWPSRTIGITQRGVPGKMFSMFFFVLEAHADPVHR